MYRFCAIAVILGFLAGCGGGITGEKIADYDSLVATGWDRYNQSRYDEAYQLFIDARQDDGDRPEAYLGCGWSLLRRQHPDSAIVVFRTGLDYIVTLDDSVDIICGLAGSYLAHGENSKVTGLIAKYPVSSFEDSFPMKTHDFFLDVRDLEMAQAMAFYRLGLYSPSESEDPGNALYHLNTVLITPYTYVDPSGLMKEILEYMDEVKGDFIL